MSDLSFYPQPWGLTFADWAIALMESLDDFDFEDPTGVDWRAWADGARELMSELPQHDGYATWEEWASQVLNVVG